MTISCSPDNSVAPPTMQKKEGAADEKSMVLAGQIMDAMGGQDKWDNLGGVSWTFFGSRQLVWDKKGSRVRIENPRDTSTYIVDLHNRSGRYAKNGIEVTDTSIVNKKVIEGINIWINDSYWLVMPFKLRDEGVTLKYVREDTITADQKADVLELTFEKVGVTPNNKYEVYVDHADQLIKKWSFFKDAKDDAPARSWLWDNYVDFDGLMLSTDRSDKSGPSAVKTYITVPNQLFEKF